MAIGLPFLFSCSFSSSAQSSFLNIKGSALSELGLERISSNPLIYRLASSSLPSPMFASFIRECPVKSETGLAATTRELFIGFDNLQILTQEEKDLDGTKYYLSRASATIDGTSVSLFSVSMHEEQCVKDGIFWLSGTDSSGPDPFAALAQDPSGILKVLEGVYEGR